MYLFSRELIFLGAYYWKEFCVSKWVGLVNKNSLKHYKNSINQLALKVYVYIYLGGLIIGRIFASAIWRGLFFFRGEGGILWYIAIMKGDLTSCMPRDSRPVYTSKEAEQLG